MDTATGYTEAVTTAVEDAISAAGTTVNAVATGAGMTRNLFMRRIAGRNFTIPELARIAAHLGIPVEQLTAPRRAA